VNIKIKRIAYHGLSGGGFQHDNLLEKIGQAKKAATNLARSNALSRLCLVLLDKSIRYVHVLPADKLIETSIIWDNSNPFNPKPDLSMLPCTFEEEDDDNDDGELEKENNPRILNNMQRILDDLDVKDVNRIPVQKNVRLDKAMREAYANQQQQQQHDDLLDDGEMT
jgi:hypothetical protein